MTGNDAYKLAVLDAILAGLFEGCAAYLEKKLLSLDKQHREYFPLQTFTGFRHGRETYATDFAPFYKLQELPVVLVPQLLDIKADMDALVEDGLLVKSWLRAAMNLCHTPADLKLVLPEEIQDLWLPLLSHMGDVTLTDEQVILFLGHDPAGPDLIRSRLVLNLLMR